MSHRGKAEAKHEPEEEAKDEEKATPEHKLPGWIGLVAVIVSAMAPLTTAVHGWLSASESQTLNREKQQHEIRIQYLDRAIDQSKDLPYRKAVLRCLIATTDEKDAIRGWAREEASMVDAEEKDLVKQRDDAVKAKEEAEKLAAEKNQRIAQLEVANRDPGKHRGELDGLRNDLEQARIAALKANGREEYLSARLQPHTYPPSFGYLQRMFGVPRCKEGTLAAQPLAASTADALKPCKDSLPRGRPYTIEAIAAPSAPAGYRATWLLPGASCACEIE
jgi:hypothetical protein